MKLNVANSQWRDTQACLHPRRDSRCGTVLICTLVCLLVASSLVLVNVATAVRAQREIRQRHQVLQTDWLLEAGIRRAVKSIEASAGYAGETWIPEPESLEFAEAQVTIRVERLERDEDEDFDWHEVTAVATLCRSVATPAMRIATRTQKSDTLEVSTSKPSPITDNE